MTSAEDARAVITEVREENGGVSPEESEDLKENRPATYRALRNARRNLAASIKMYSRSCMYLQSH